jgi:hypothetical protein
MFGKRSCSIGSICALSCLLLACGDDEGGNRVSTGLPEDKQLSELTVDDLMMACESASASFGNIVSEEESKRIDCTAGAIPASFTIKDGKASGDVAKCKQLVNECLAAGPSSGPNEGPIDTDLGAKMDCSADGTAEQFEGCTATVGEYEDCVNAAIGEFERFFTMINCDSLANPEMVRENVSAGIDIGALPACKGLPAKCPHLSFGGEDDEAESSGQ